MEALLSLLLPWLAIGPLIFGVFAEKFPQRRFFLLLVLLVSFGLPLKIASFGFIHAMILQFPMVLPLFWFTLIPIIFGGLAAKYPRKRILFLSLLILLVGGPGLVLGMMMKLSLVWLAGTLSICFGPLLFGMIAWTCPGWRRLAITGVVLCLVVPYGSFAVWALTRPLL